MIRRSITLCAVALVSAGLLSSCKTAPVRHTAAYVPAQPPVIREYDVVLAPQPVARKTVYHVVAPGETVWRIGKMYDAAVPDIMRANNLRTPQELEIGQRLTIPAAATTVPRPVVSLYPSTKWQYIVVHHSATDEGNSLEFNEAHNVRGFKGIGYHFVIDNGTKGKPDGMIETTPRWTKQLEGAHCRANGMNHNSIGICLVGNFSEDRVSPKQMASLVYLVDTLRDYYRIPPKRIMGHGQVKGAATECPGTHFPWNEFYRKLDTAGYMR